MDDVSSSLKEDLWNFKSAPVYHQWKKKYDSYKIENGFQMDSIGVFMEFIRSLSKSYKISSIWQAASCINKFLRIDSNLDFIGNPVFKSFMKNLGKKQVPKKSAVLELSHINRYIMESEKSNHTLQVCY